MSEEGVPLDLMGEGASVRSTSAPVILHVGQQLFHTDEAAVMGSNLLLAMLAERKVSTKPDDNTYFLSDDPEIFKHTLRFLHHGVYPLFYDATKGHDFAMYAAIYTQADHFDIPNLKTWLKEQQYFKAVTATISAVVFEGVNDLNGSHDSDLKVQYFPAWVIKKKYMCPRGVRVHYDHAEACGKACREARGDNEIQYGRCAELSVMVLTEKVVFHLERCVDT